MDDFIAESQIHGNSIATGIVTFFVSCAQLSRLNMKIKVGISLVVLLCLVLSDVIAGKDALSSSSRRAIKAYNKAKDFYARRDFEKAQLYANKAFTADRFFTEAYLLGGDIAAEMNNSDLAIQLYENAISINPDLYPPAFYILGNIYYSLGNYEKSVEHYRHYLGLNLPAREKEIVIRRLENAQVAYGLKSEPVPFNPVNLCDKINTGNDEYVNAISADGSLLIFTVRSPHIEPATAKQFKEEFYYSDFSDGQWVKAQPLKQFSGGLDSEGALALSYDNQQIYFTACHQPGGYGSCDLYFSLRTGESWSEPRNLGPMINSSRWESQPSLSPDGKTLYFASNRQDGQGGSDIWKSVRNNDGAWNRPENLGNMINTAGDEMAPYIHADGKTLYFSSKGHPGLGGADLFMSRLKDDGSWTKPLNLGYPINTVADEINLIVHPDGQRAYISSDLQTGKGGYDIYEFALYDAIKPLPVSYIKGTVRDALTRKPLDSNIELIELEHGNTAVYSKSDKINGEFIVVLPGGADYALNVNRQGYLFYSHHFALDSVVSGILNPVILDIYLKPIELGQVVILKNVFFAHDSYELETVSQAELSRLIKFMNENPEIILEISGHTDNTGSSVYNLVLSANRAKAVNDFLVNHGIPQTRIRYLGFGETVPIETNDTPEGRSVNRRTEFRIVNNNTE